ncbi:hypothetical protein EYC84_011478 [Monilinia fructicola]|uniref:Uncharacterized protein n=1 Tax=Monilinia fructicola TaxID=38448 RepID=A0A5M9J5A3_MONFR|nr:hypothetical protein EYC84_011478 [Monilinia fructicola]
MPLKASEATRGSPFSRESVLKRSERQEDAEGKVGEGFAQREAGGVAGWGLSIGFHDVGFAGGCMAKFRLRDAI